MPVTTICWSEEVSLLLVSVEVSAAGLALGEGEGVGLLWASELAPGRKMATERVVARMVNFFLNVSFGDGVKCIIGGLFFDSFCSPLFHFNQ
ncbi:MAG: hypothetical protein QM796_07145 [Chthoniobacteraceae bacterium]